MLMPKKHRTLIYEYLMREGVVVAEKDFGLDKHPVIAVPNIHVIKALQVSCRSSDGRDVIVRFPLSSHSSRAIWSRNSSPGVIIIGT